MRNSQGRALLDRPAMSIFCAVPPSIFLSQLFVHLSVWSVEFELLTLYTGAFVSCTSHETAFLFEVLFAVGLKKWHVNKLLLLKEKQHHSPLSFLVVASIRAHVSVADPSLPVPYIQFDYPTHYCVVLKSDKRRSWKEIAFEATLK